MNALPEAVQGLVAELARLPGIGPRSSERIALHIIRTDPAEVGRLAEAVLAARDRVQLCERCGGLTEVQPCPICADPRRDASLLCIVEQPVDLLILENSRVFSGRYHVLGGVLSPVNAVEPEDLRIDALERRLATEPIREVVVALGTSVEGDATGHYLAQRLSRRGVRVTRIAYGLPAGSGLEYADDVTLARAMEGRRDLAP